MVLIELVVEQGPVVLGLDVLSPLPQSDRSLSCHVLLLLLRAKSGSPVHQGQFQLVYPPTRDGLGEGRASTKKVKKHPIECTS